MLKNPRLRLALALSLTILVCTGAGTALVAADNGPSRVSVSTTLKNAAGDKVAFVEFSKGAGGTVTVFVRGRGLPPGFHGMHVHAVGTCEAPGFTSAGGHLKIAGSSHPEHSGDLTSLYVKSDGTVSARFETDRLSPEAVRDMDGSAVMIHAGPDNFGNIPSRYAPNGPDQITRDTGDSGARIACGPIR